jgi:hypothetical protein
LLYFPTFIKSGLHLCLNYSGNQFLKFNKFMLTFVYLSSLIDFQFLLCCDFGLNAWIIVVYVVSAVKTVRSWSSTSSSCSSGNRIISFYTYCLLSSVRIILIISLFARTEPLTEWCLARNQMFRSLVENSCGFVDFQLKQSRGNILFQSRYNFYLLLLILGLFSGLF